MRVLEQMIKNLPTAAYACDSTGLITAFNEAAVRLWGRSPKLQHPDDRYCGSFKLYNVDGEPIDHASCWMAKALQQKATFNGQEIVIERPDGSHAIALAHANPIVDAEGRLLGAVNVLVDVTLQRQRSDLERIERREQEQILMTYQRLAVFGQLVAGFAHEVRNPLASILSATELARRRHLAGKDPSDLLDVVQRQVERLKALMDDMLQHARSSRQAPVLVDPCAAMERALDQALQQFGPQAAKVTVERSCAVGRAKVLATDERLQRLLNNLIMNALQALPESGGRLRASAVVEAGQARLRIEDDGAGIPATVMPRLFEPFYTTKPTGSGLGLWIAQSLSNEMGGRLHAEALQPHGAAFTLSLPVASGTP